MKIWAKSVSEKCAVLDEDCSGLMLRVRKAGGAEC